MLVKNGLVEVEDGARVKELIDLYFYIEMFIQLPEKLQGVLNFLLMETICLLNSLNFKVGVLWKPSFIC